MVTFNENSEEEHDYSGYKSSWINVFTKCPANLSNSCWPLHIPHGQWTPVVY